MQSKTTWAAYTLKIELLPWLRLLAAGLSKRESGFDIRPVLLRFMVDEVALGQAFLRQLRDFLDQNHSGSVPR
jgi:hypothetical protein